MVCLMVGHVCEREVAGMARPASTATPTVATTPNSSDMASMVTRTEQYSNEMSWEDAKKLEVAITLSVLIGFLKVQHAPFHS